MIRATGAPLLKVMLAKSDTDTEWQADETDPFLAVNYTKLDRVPLFSEGWGSVVEAMQAGTFMAQPTNCFPSLRYFRDRSRAAPIPRVSNGHFRSSLRNWFGAIARKAIARSLPPRTCRPFNRMSSRSHSMRRGRDGFASRCGTRPAIAPTLSRS
jgi:hypothetical protein